MTDYDMRCGKKCVREYVLSSMTSGSLISQIPLILTSALMISMPVIGIIGFFALNATLMLILAAGALVLDIVIVLLMLLLINSTSEKLYKAYSKQDGLICSVGENDIILVMDNRPVRVIAWDSVSEYHEGKSAFFIKAKDDTLMILDKEKVMSGTITETSEIFEQKTKNE